MDNKYYLDDEGVKELLTGLSIKTGAAIKKESDRAEAAESDLAESIYYYHAAATITASPTLIEKGVNTTINITATSSFKTEGAKTLTIKNVTASKDLTGSGTTARMTAADSISNTTTFQAVAVFNYNVTKTANVTVTAKYPIFALESQKETLTNSDVIGGTKYVKSSPAGNYTITLSKNLTYFWICVPSDMTINKVQLSGFDVTMEPYQSVQIEGKDTYKCYRSYNSNDAGTYTLVVS